MSYLGQNPQAPFTFRFLDHGDQSGAFGINWATALKQAITLTGNMTLTMSAPAGQSSNYVLAITQGGVGGFNITWGGNTRSSSSFQVSGAAGSVTIFSIFWDGTTFTISSYLPNTSPAVSTVA